ncbi:hypothetical protein ANCCAN_21334 [Ancylostoma caninum]|uniref:Uncharacterized protein n=1 Tax=Ancylostoma caninum TaxID=29170 RepID=A0A368FPX8_ANCCA|nr:hypothetical protein ANCCAN_21334 [Ancylostoma caninum]
MSVSTLQRRDFQNQPNICREQGEGAGVRDPVGVVGADPAADRLHPAAVLRRPTQGQAGAVLDRTKPADREEQSHFGRAAVADGDGRLRVGDVPALLAVDAAAIVALRLLVASQPAAIALSPNSLDDL